MRNAEALHLDIADLKTRAGLKRFQARLAFAPIDGRRGEARHINDGADVFVARQHGQAGDVVGMLVGDEDGVEVFQVFADGGQAFGELSHAQARVHQDARLSVASSAALPELPLASTQNLTMAASSLTLQNTPNPTETERTKNVVVFRRAACVPFPTIACGGLTGRTAS